MDFKFNKKSLEINDTLVISDLHFGIEDELNKKGHLISDSQKNLIQQLIELTKNKKRLIICGDLKNNYKGISSHENRDIKNLIKELSVEITLIKGNHDNMLSYMFDDKTIYDYYFLNKFLFTHGHIPIEELKMNKLFKEKYKNIKYIVIGHEHPSISLFDNKRYERFKCFLKTHYDSKELIVLPSFSDAAFGYDFTKENFQSDYLSNKNLSEIKVYLYEDKLYEFDSLKQIIESNKKQ
ncbi:MAG: metallophosphoesterase [Candidatus Woesearchaeota archaeon]